MSDRSCTLGGREGWGAEAAGSRLRRSGELSKTPPSMNRSERGCNYREIKRALREDEGGKVHWLGYGEPREGSPPPVRFAFIDPAASAYPALDVVEKQTAPTSALEATVELATNFIETSRRRELLALLEETSDAVKLSEQMQLTQNQLPTISSQLGAFFGFFERDFRVLDFYLGMYDGLVSVRRTLAIRHPGGDPEQLLRAEFPVLRRAMPVDLASGWKPFACLLSQVEPRYAAHAPACDGPELRNFRILLQVTLDRLHTACARAPEAELPPQASPLCFAAARRMPRVAVRGVPAIEPDRWRRISDELDFHYTLRLLREYGFEYRDLGLSVSQAKYGPVKIRRMLLSMSSDLADKQPTALGSQRTKRQTSSRGLLSS
jgi:hypothetical protein